jgi:repressor LexA
MRLLRPQSAISKADDGLAKTFFFQLVFASHESAVRRLCGGWQPGRSNLVVKKIFMQQSRLCMLFVLCGKKLGGSMAIGLTKRQGDILGFIREHTAVRGYPPSFREIGRQFGIKSTNGVKVHLDALERKGYITRGARVARGIEMNLDAKAAGSVRQVPIIGRVAAGVPILAEQNLDGYLAVDTTFVQADGVFALTVSGDSMKDAGIYNGDYVLGKPVAQYFPGDVIVAIIGDEATVKRYYPEGDRVRLEPANSSYGPIIVEKGLYDFRIAGKVIAVMRRM